MLCARWALVTVRFISGHGALGDVDAHHCIPTGHYHLKLKPKLNSRSSSRRGLWFMIHLSSNDIRIQSQARQKGRRRRVEGDLRDVVGLCLHDGPSRPRSASRPGERPVVLVRMAGIEHGGDSGETRGCAQARGRAHASSNPFCAPQHNAQQPQLSHTNRDPRRARHPAMNAAPRSSLAPPDPCPFPFVLYTDTLRISTSNTSTDIDTNNTNTNTHTILPTRAHGQPMGSRPRPRWEIPPSPH